MPLSRTATPTPFPLYPRAHTAGAFTAVGITAGAADFLCSLRSTETNLTLSSFSKSSRADEGIVYTPEWTAVNSEITVPPRADIFSLVFPAFGIPLHDHLHRLPFT